MTVTKEVSVDLQEKYQKVVKLMDDCKFDPESDSNASKHLATEILHGMTSTLENLLNSHSVESDEKLRLTAMLGVVYMYLGMMSINNEDLQASEIYLGKCEETIKEHSELPQMAMVSLNLYNQYGILWSRRDPEKAKTYLEKADQLYLTFKNTTQIPIDMNDLFCPHNEPSSEEISWKNYEKMYTFTLYYLAQIYGAQNDSLKSSIYCHITLQRQLDSGDYDPVDWALNAATLSQFFMEKNGFKQARHHLAASSAILDQHEASLNAITERNDAFDAKFEEFKHRSADVARCWAKYGLLLLSKSKERLMNHTDDIDTNCTLSSDLAALNLNASVTVEELQHLEFTSLDLSRYENQITYKFVLTIQDARLVFLNVQAWLQRAESYYTLDTQASDHIEIIQDKSQMYLYFLFFEENPDIQAKLHKRRIDLFENVVNKINPQYYLQYCRQIWFDLGQTYYEILNIKSDKLRETNERPTPQMLTKINHLIEKSLCNFERFIDSFKTGENKELPREIPKDYVKAFLQAYFHVGALNSKFITLDKRAQLKNVEASYDAYIRICDYCNDNEDAKDVIPMELNVCKEMAALLPVKIAKLRQELD